MSNIYIMSYPIGNMLIGIKNAQAVGKENVLIPFSKIKLRILEILKDGGFIENFERRKKKGIKVEHEYLFVTLKYHDKEGAITNFKLVSKPSRHMYVGVEDLKPVRSGYGMAVVSTSKGIMSSKEAKKNNLGGEMLFEVW